MTHRRNLAFAACLVFHLAAHADEPTQITIRGQDFKVWPTEDLIARGFDVPAVSPEENAAPLYIEAVNAYEELPVSMSTALEYAADKGWPADATELVDYLLRPGNRAALDRLRQAADRPRCRMAYFGDPRKDSVVALIIPNLASQRFLARLAVAEGRRLASEEMYAQALDECFTVMRMASHLSEGITLIEGLVGLAVFATGNNAVTDIVLREPLTRWELRTLLWQLDEYAPRLPTVEAGLHGERAFGPAVVDELCSRPFRPVANLQAFLALVGDGSGGDGLGAAGDPNDGWSRLERRVGRLFFPDQAIKQHMAGFYDHVESRARGGPTAGDGLSDDRYVTEKIPAWDVISRMLLPSLDRATTLGVRVRADFALTRTASAIRLYTLEHDGRAPDDLETVAQMIPAGAMVDPFDGRPLKYRKTGDGWMLYSIGPNAVDDGGRSGERWDEFDICRRFPPDPPGP